MSERKINLGEIFENNFDCYADVDTYHACMPNWYKNEDTMAMTKEKFVNIIKEAIKQTLELAAENASNSHNNRWERYPYVINKQSILDTINQIE